MLLEIDEHGHMTMGQLSSNLKLDISTLSRTVDNLVAKKLVARLRDESDRRLVWIRLTEDGVSTCNEVHKVNDENCLLCYLILAAAKSYPSGTVPLQRHHLPGL